jgi:hypothetical protein
MPVTQLTKRCWTLQTVERTDVEVPHWDTEQEAQAALSDYFPAEDFPACTVKATGYPAPCWTVTCDGQDCGGQADNDDYGWHIHFESRLEAERYVTREGWMLTTNGEALCPDDVAEIEAASRLVIEQIRGQLTIDGEAGSDAC